MTKEDIYKIIGYNGEYNNNVKKAIRKLLKENHPDNKGNQENFKLINEVKKELETNKISYKINKKEKKYYDDIDYDFCNKKIEEIRNKIKNKKELLEEIKIKMKDISNEYSKYYNESINKENYLLSKKINNKLTTLKNKCIIVLIIAIIAFISAIIGNNIYLFILFGILSMILIFEVYRLYNIFQDITKNNSKYVHEYVSITKKLNDIRKSKDKLNEELYKEKRNLLLLENDLRFYNNLLKKE